MPFPLLTTLPDFRTVAPGATAVLDVPVGYNYQQINLVTSATAQLLAAIIGEVRLLVNDVVQRRFTPAEADACQKLYGTQYGSTSEGAGAEQILPIFLAQPWRNEYAAQQGYGWNTQGWSSFKIEVDILAGAAANVSLKADCVRDRRAPVVINGVRLDVIEKWYRIQIPALASGAGADVEFDFADMPTNRGAINGVNIADANLKQIRVDVDSATVRRFDSLARNSRLLGHWGMTQQAGYTQIAFDHTDEPGGALFVPAGTKEFNWHFKRGAAGALAAGNMSSIVQILGSPDGQAA